MPVRTRSLRNNINSKKFSQIDVVNSVVTTKRTAKNSRKSLNKSKGRKRYSSPVIKVVSQRSPKPFSKFIKGYTLSEGKKYFAIKNKLILMTVKVLKDYLRTNNQPTTGDKERLVQRCADGLTLGSIPECPVCSKAVLNYSIWTGFYYCSDPTKKCRAKFTKTEIRRKKWYKARAL
ncbi:unnamed protein product [Moneuplotes crassus]|uniref:SAP domain-containing protein n=1 Tax=Euplotes crassus TaxID=5936 RepID=A0AAD1XW29_EUPCR|nr:unnamed protein product [Moneuplotes crassus]